MIRLVLPGTSDERKAEDFLTRRGDPFACKIHGNITTYGITQSRLDSIVGADGDIIGLLGTLEDQAVLCADHAGNAEEIASYLRMGGYLELMAEGSICKRIAPYLPGWRMDGSAILATTGSPQPPRTTEVIRNGDLSGVFDLLVKPFSLDPTTGDAFERDLRYRIERWVCDLYTVREGEALRSTAAVTRAPGLRLIGSVATDPAYRGKGYARAILRTIQDDHRGDRIAVMALHDGVIGFYQSLGFTIEGHWGRLRR